MYKVILVALDAAALTDVRGVHTLRYDVFPRVGDVRIVPLDTLRRDGFAVPETAPRLTVRTKDRKLTAIEVDGVACVSLIVGGATYAVGLQVQAAWVRGQPVQELPQVRRVNALRPLMVAAE